MTLRRRLAISVAIILALGAVALAACGPAPVALPASAPPFTPGASIEQHPTSGPAASTAQHPATPPHAVTIAVIGDFGVANRAEGSVASLVAAWSPDAVIAVGDDYYAEAGGTGLARYDRTIGAYYCPFLHGAYAGEACSSGGTATENRFWSTPGNHDYSDAGIDQYVGYLPLPGGKTWFSVRVGSAEFFILDAERALSDAAAMAAQRAWLATATTASTARWRIAVFHQPAYSSGDVHGSTRAMRWPFAAMGIGLVLNGHEHTYERFVIDGVTYVVDGLGGAGRYGFGKPLEGSMARYAADWGALRLDITTDTLHGEFMSEDGIARDAFTLGP
jgi:hypothetical protein